MSRIRVMLICAALIAPGALSAAEVDIETSRAQAAGFLKELRLRLQAGMAESPMAAIAVCQDEAPKIAERWSTESAVVRRTALKLRQPRNVANNADRVVGTCDNPVANIGHKFDAIGAAGEIDCHKGGIVDGNPDLFDGGHKKVIRAILADDPRKQPDKLWPTDRRPQIEPRPIPRDPHIDVPAKRRVPKMHRRRPLTPRRTGRSCEVFCRRGHDLLF